MWNFDRSTSNIVADVRAAVGVKVKQSRLQQSEHRNKLSEP
jgi:hypothetical protein